VPHKNDPKSLSQQRYSQFAQGYVSSSSHAKGADLDRLLELARPQADWVVLDVATGGGHTALKFAPHVAKVFATDLTPRMLEAAAKHIGSKGISNVVFELADAENLPYESATFDLVTCRIAPHHFPDAGRFVRESARVLKSNGLFLMQDHVLPTDDGAARYVDAFEKLRDPSHNRAFSEPEWRRMFQDAALVLEHAEQIIKRHDFAGWVERQGCTTDVVTRLERMIAEAPTEVADWLQPKAFGSPQASFVNHHIIIAGRATIG
jgi:ubiquinone/menaquinone biosynthesis C-methylase UbiE